MGGIFALATGKGGGGGGGGRGHEKRMLKNEAGHIILNLAKGLFFSSCTACILFSSTGLLYDEQQTA